MEYGLYEKILSEELKKDIGNQEYKKTRHIDNSELSRVLSITYQKIIRETLSSIDKDTERIEFINNLNKTIGIADFEYENEKFKELLSVHHDKGSFNILNEYRPKTSISTSTLFTGNSGPTLESELSREIRTADEIDFLISFIKFSGLRLIYDDLVEFTKTKKLRVITTSYMGASNLSNPALSNGLEWNLKISEYTSKDVVDSFNKTFESYWNDEEFKIFEPRDEENRKELKDSLRNQERDVNSYVFFDLKPYSHQKEILEDLKLEREEYNSYRNLVVAATGERVIIVMGAINALKSRVSGALTKYNSCIA